MSKVSLSCCLLYLQKQALWLSPGLTDLVSTASQITPRKPCLCLLRAGVMECQPGPFGFSISSEVPDSHPMLKGYIFYPL